MRTYVLNIFRAVVILANVLLPLNPVVAYAASATDSANLPARIAPAPAAAPLSPDAFLTNDDLLARYLPVADSASGAIENHTVAPPSGAAEIAPPAGLTLSAPEIVQKFGAPAANSAAIATGNPADTDLLPAWFALPTTENADASSGITGDLLPAWFKSDTGSDDAGTSPAMPVAPRETRSTANATIIPQVQVTVEAPPNVSEGKPGGDVYTVTVHNGSSSATASNFYITATIPALGFAYVPGSAQLVTSPGGTLITITEGYTNRLVVWTPSPAFDLLPGATVVLTFSMTTDENAISGQRLDVNAVYDSQGSPGSNNGGVNITVGRGNLVISKSPSNQNATYGDIVSWDVEVANTGLGDVYSVTIGDIPGTGFTNVDTGQNPGFIPQLAIGERFSFPVTATVNSCYSLTNVATGNWSIGNEDGTGTATDPVSDTTDITYQLSPPSLSLASNSLAFGYCTPAAQTVVVTVTNSGGAATNFVLDSNLESQPFTVNNVAAGWSYNSATGEFTPPNGVVTTTQMVLSFDVTPTFDVCSSNDGGISFNARFTDPCELPFNGPSTTVNYTYANGELPSLSVTKSADRDVTYTGDTMNFTVNFNAQNTQNIDGNIVITDVVPASMAINAFTPTVGSVAQNGNQLVWTIDSGSIAALTGQLDINVSVLDTGGVCAANNIADNTVEARAAVTCSTCPDLTSSDTADVIVQNAPVGNLDKTVTSDGQICGVLNITNTYALSITDWSNIVFTETLGTRDGVSGLEYQAGTLQVLVGGIDYAVNATIVQTTPQLIVDLSGLTAAGAPTGTNVQLEIDYDIFAPDSVLNGAPTLRFFDWSELYVPGSGAQSCTGDDTFYQGAWIDLQRADLQIAIDPGTTVGCAPTTVTLTVSDADLVANNLVANNIVVTYSVGSPDFDSIDWGSMAYGGGFAGNPVTVVSGSNTITWTFTNPLTQTGTTTGTISFGMNRSCTAPPMDAGVSFSDRCDVSYSNPTHTAAAISRPDLHLFVTPDTYMLNEQTANWDINVYNGGPGIAYRVLVTDVIGSGLGYNTFTPTVTPAGGATVNLVSSTGGTVVWEVLNMQPGTLVKLAVLADLNGCTNLTSDVTMDGNCPGESCYPVETDSTNFILPPVSIRSSNAQTADLPFCGTGEVVLTVKNSSATAHIYNTTITETIHSLSYVAGTAVMTVTDKNGNIVDGLANVPFEPHTETSGTDTLLVWSLDYTTTTQHDEILRDRAAEDSIEVVFDVQTDCSTPGFNFVRAEASGNTACNAFFFRRESAVTLDTIQPIITLNKEGRNVTRGETAYSLNVNGEPGDVIEWRITANNDAAAYVARNVVITDAAPSNMVFTGAANVNGSVNVTQTASGVEWNIGDLPADGNDYVLVITGTVNTGSGSVCELTTNRARLTYGCDAGCRAEPIEATANLQTCPVLTLQLTPATTNNCGGELNFTIVNSGPPAYNVILTDTLPSGYFYASTTFSSTLPTTMPTVGSATPVWGWSVLPTGSTEVHFAVNSGTGGMCGLPSTGVNTVTVQYESAVTYTNRGPYYAGPATAGVTVQQPNLLLTITPAQQNADANQVVTWTITVANTGAGDAQGVLITDVVSSGFTPTTVLASNGSDADETNTPTVTPSGTAPNDFTTITWSPAVTIAAGDTWSAVVTATTRDTGINFNAASISGHCNAGCLYTTDVFTAHVTLLTTFDKSPAVQTGTIGSVVTFTLSAALPDIDALYQNVIVTDTLPAGLGFVAATLSYTSDVDGNGNPIPGTQLSDIPPTPNPGQYNSGAVVWNLGDLPGTVQVSGVLTAVIQNVSQAYDGAALINRLDMTYLNDGRDYIFTDTAEVDVQEPVLHIGKTYVTPPGCGATLYLENFNDGSADGGWNSIGTWSVVNGIYQNTSVSNNRRAFVGDTTWTDYSYSFMMRTTDAAGSMGGYVRQQGGTLNASYLFSWSNTGMSLGIPGQPALDSNTTAYETNRWYHVEMRAIGNLIEVYVDGVRVLSATDSTYPSGRVGVHSHQLNLVQFDDILVTKMDDMGCTIGANQLVTYTLFISNQWTLPGYDLVITDDLPISTSLVSYAFSSDDGAATVSSGPSAGATGTVVWNVNQLTNESPFTGLDHPGITITVVVQVDDGVPANFILPSQVWLAYDGQPATGPLGIEREYSGGSHSTALRTVDAGLAKTVTFAPPPTATLGSLVTYTIIAPSSPITATLYGVVITDQLQSPQYYIENVSATGGTNPAFTSDQNSGLITATFDSIPHDTQATITVTARISHEFPSAATDPNGGDVITNSAVMSYSTGVTESNVVSTDVHEPHVQISKTAAVNATDPRTMDYTVTVTNIGDADAFSLNVTDATPGGTTVSNIGQGGVLLADGRTISWTISSLAVGASQNLNYQLTLNQSIYTSTLFTNTAIVTNTSLTSTIPGVRPYVTDTVHTFPLPMGRIGDYVWLDADYDGVQGGTNDTPIGGVVVNLYDSAGNFITTTTTAADGSYIFQYLPLSTTYVVQLDTSNFGAGGALQPYTTTLTGQGTPATDSNADANAMFLGNGYAITTTLTAAITEDLTLDYGFAALMSLGNQVWYDQNDNGILNALEVGISGVVVELYRDTDGSGDFSAGDTPLGSTTTNAGGYYTFTNLYPGDYVVVITDTNFTGAGALVNYLPSSPAPDGGNADVNNHNHGAASGTLGAGGIVASTVTTLINNTEPITDGDTDANSNLTIDFGFVQRDWGDLPDTPYPTLSANNGARHIILPAGNPTLGATVDAETDGQPSVNADGDDTTNTPDDEDGVTWSPLVAGQTAIFTVTASQATGYLNGWIDFNGDGDFNDVGEQVFTDQSLALGANALNVTLPSTATTAGLYMRFRYSTQTGLTPTGEAPDGEVEDYLAAIVAYDLGDLPDGLQGAPSYPTLLANSGARHLISPTLYLGNLVDAEGDGQPTVNANGDDITGVIDDEDGVTWTPLVLGQTATFTVTTNSADQGYLNAWIDFNGNGVLDDAGEQIVTDALLNSGTNTFAVPVPATATSGSLYMRFRYSTQQGLTPTGDAPDGEVEDYVASTILYDLGDLPDTYGTTLANSGARHVIEPFLYLGDRVDAEGDGQPSINANGDDANVTTGLPTNGDDEDGISWSTLNLGQTATFTVTSASVGQGLVNGWIDFNGDGDFADAGEHIFTDATLGTGTLTASVTIPLTATTGNLYMRFRYSTQPELAPTGDAPDGEVEDYVGQVILRDWGDLPEGPYPTTLAQNGARHIILPAGNPTLGATVDDEIDGQPNATATGDDIARTPDDEDGVQLMTPLVAGQVATFTITATNTTDAQLVAWMDFNGDGDFADTGETIFSGISLANGANILTITVPSVVLSDTINARFRYSTQAGLTPTGEAWDGEVEDYQFAPTNLVSLGDLVWFDYNNNGIFDSGAGESGVSGITVELYNAGDTAGTDAPVATATTDANGRYLFTDIPEGGYFVHIPPSQFTAGQPLYGYDSTVPTQTDPNTDQNEDVDENGIPVSGTADVAGVSSGVVTVTVGTEPTGEDVNNIDPTTPDASSNLTVDFGFYIAGAGITTVKTVQTSPNVNHATVRYTVTVTNSGQVALFPVLLTDTLPTELTFVPGTGTPTDPDTVNGQTLGWNNIVTVPLQPGQGTQVGFDAQITAGYTGTFINVVTATGVYTGGTVTDTSSVPIEVRDPAVDLLKQVVPPGAVNGVITYTITVSNVGPSVLDVVPLFDFYDSTYLTFTVSTPPEDYRAPGEIRWNDLTQSFGRNLAPGERFVITTTFGVIREITQTVNRAVVSGTTDIYVNPAPPVTDTVTITNTPTAVDLLYFDGEQVGDTVQLRWSTASEIDNYAFFIYRGETANRDDAVEISGGIPAQGVGGGGAEYTFTDDTVVAGTTYHYWLVDMDTAGALTWHYPPIELTITANGGIGADFTNWIYLPLIVK